MALAWSHREVGVLSLSKNMMRMVSAGMSLFHGSSDTNTPYNNFHQLTAPDIDLNEFEFFSLKDQVLIQHQVCVLTVFKCHSLTDSASLRRLSWLSTLPPSEARQKLITRFFFWPVTCFESCSSWLNGNNKAVFFRILRLLRRLLLAKALPLSHFLGAQLMCSDPCNADSNSFFRTKTVLHMWCSNQFLSQEPGTNEEIKKFARDKGFKGVLMDKVDVNGPKASPVYSFLKVRLNRATPLSCMPITSGIPVARDAFTCLLKLCYHCCTNILARLFYMQ